MTVEKGALFLTEYNYASSFRYNITKGSQECSNAPENYAATAYLQKSSDDEMVRVCIDVEDKGGSIPNIPENLQELGNSNEYIA